MNKVYSPEREPRTGLLGSHIGTLALPFSQLAMTDVATVGGKNASLGELIRNMAPLGIAVPDGFATTADAYRQFIQANDLVGKIAEKLARYKAGREPLEKAGREIRNLIRKGRMRDNIV